MKPKRCQEWVQFSRTEGICIGAYGHAVLEECRGYMKKDCPCYWHITDKDVIKVTVRGGER